MARVVIGGLLLAHGAVHLLYLVPAPKGDANWPFAFDGSWLIPAPSRRGVGITMIVLIFVVYLLVALSVWGIPGMAMWLRPLLIAGSVASLALFTAYWHPWLSFGAAIAIGLALIALTDPGWWDRLLG